MSKKKKETCREKDGVGRRWVDAGIFVFPLETQTNDDAGGASVRESREGIDGEGVAMNEVKKAKTMARNRVFCVTREFLSIGCAIMVSNLHFFKKQIVNLAHIGVFNRHLSYGWSWGNGEKKTFSLGCLDIGRKGSEIWWIFLFGLQKDGKRKCVFYIYGPEKVNT